MNLYAPDIKKLMIFIANNILQKSCLLRELCPDTKVRYFLKPPFYLKSFEFETVPFLQAFVAKTYLLGIDSYGNSTTKTLKRSRLVFRKLVTKYDLILIQKDDGDGNFHLTVCK